MADARINVVIDGDASDLISAGKQAEGAMTGLGNSVKKLPPTFNQFDNSLKKTSGSLNQLGSSAKKAKFPMIEVGRVIQDLPFGFAGIANNLTQIIPGVGLLGLAFSGLVSAITFSQVGLSAWGVRADKASGSAKDLKTDLEILEEQQKALKDAFDAAAGSIIDQADNLSQLGKALIDTSNKTQILSGAIVKQGLAQFLFTQKEGLAQKIISDALENQLKFYKGSIKFAVKEFEIKKKTSELKPIRIATEDELKAAGIGLNQTEQQLFDLNQLAAGLGIKFDDFVKKAKDPGPDKAFDDLMKRVREFERFINQKTIRFANFEIDPTDSKEEQIKKANQFISDVLNNRRVFFIKPQVEITAIDFKPTEKAFEALRKQAKTLFNALQKEIQDQFKRNPIIIEAANIEAKVRQRAQTFFGELGIPTADVNAAPDPLTKLQRAAVETAKVVNSTLTPAFTALFDAIAAGESPLKAFFDSIKQAITQLIQKLIAALVQALLIKAVLSALGLGSTVGGIGQIFGQLLGFRAQGGPVMANQPYVVGERGPELFIPSRGGQIVSNRQTQAALATVSPGNLNVNVNGQISGKNIRLVGARQGRFNDRNV